MVDPVTPPTPQQIQAEIAAIPVDTTKKDTVQDILNIASQIDSLSASGGSYGTAAATATALRQLAQSISADPSVWNSDKREQVEHQVRDALTPSGGGSGAGAGSGGLLLSVGQTADSAADAKKKLLEEELEQQSNLSDQEARYREQWQKQAERQKEIERQKETRL